MHVAKSLEKTVLKPFAFAKVEKYFRTLFAVLSITLAQECYLLVCRLGTTFFASFRLTCFA